MSDCKRYIHPVTKQEITAEQWQRMQDFIAERLAPKKPQAVEPIPASPDGKYYNPVTKQEMTAEQWQRMNDFIAERMGAKKPQPVEPSPASPDGKYYNPVTKQEMTAEQWQRMQDFIQNRLAQPRRLDCQFERSILLPGEKRFRDKGLEY